MPNWRTTTIAIENSNPEAFQGLRNGNLPKLMSGNKGRRIIWDTHAVF